MKFGWRDENPMTPDEFRDKLTEMAQDIHKCDRHVDADNLMCQILRSLGYGEGIDIFEKMDKWYS